MYPGYELPMKQQDSYIPSEGLSARNIQLTKKLFKDTDGKHLVVGETYTVFKDGTPVFNGRLEGIVVSILPHVFWNFKLPNGRTTAIDGFDSVYTYSPITLGNSVKADALVVGYVYDVYKEHLLFLEEVRLVSVIEHQDKYYFLWESTLFNYQVATDDTDDYSYYF